MQGKKRFRLFRGTKDCNRYMKTLFVNPETDSNDILIEQCPRNKTHCKACNLLIDKGDLRVSFHRNYARGHYFHLLCFHPITQVRIRPTDIEIRIEDTQIREQVSAWVRNWNDKFRINEADISRFALKSIQTEASSHRRVLLEVFKYLKLREVVLVVTRVSKSWYHVAWENEMWSKAVLPDRHVGSREEYVTTFFSCCMHCGKYLSSDEVYMICPKANRPKCEKCYSNRKNRPQRLNWLKNEFNVPFSLIKRLELPTFTFDNVECTYIYLINDAIAMHRAALSEAILSCKSIPISSSAKAYLEQATLKDFGLFELSSNRSEFLYDRELYKVISSGEKIDKAVKMLANEKSD